MLAEEEINGLIDSRNEKTGKKIRDAEIGKIPFMLIIGEKEAENGTVSVRRHGEGDLGEMTIQAFIDFMKEQIKLK